jgi:hypothetical protein
MCSETVLNAEQVRERLRRACEEYGGETAWARKHGISPNYPWAVLKGNREPGRKVEAALGLKRAWVLDEVTHVA